MVRQDILGGLKSALARNQSLQQAMMTFYNAGYKREDIEEAVKALYQEQTSSQVQAMQAPQKPVSFFQKLFGGKTAVLEKTSTEKISPSSGQEMPVKKSPTLFGKLLGKKQEGKEEISEKNQIVQSQISQETPQKSEEKNEPEGTGEKPPFAPQKISGYGVKQEKPKGKLAVIILLISLLVLLGILASIFLFKDEISSFLNGLI